MIGKLEEERKRREIEKEGLVWGGIVFVLGWIGKEMVFIVGVEVWVRMEKIEGVIEVWVLVEGKSWGNGRIRLGRFLVDGGKGRSMG